MRKDALKGLLPKNLERIYEETLVKLQRDLRPRIQLDSGAEEGLFQIDVVELGNKLELIECYSLILSHSSFVNLSRLKGQLLPLGETLFSRSKNKNLTQAIIFFYSVLLNQVILRHEKKGIPIDDEFLTFLSQGMRYPSWEVKEWALRLCERAGKKGRTLKADWRSARPRVWDIVNPHARASQGIINILEYKFRF